VTFIIAERKGSSETLDSCSSNNSVFMYSLLTKFFYVFGGSWDGLVIHGVLSVWEQSERILGCPRDPPNCLEGCVWLDN